MSASARWLCAVMLSAGMTGAHASTEPVPQCPPSPDASTPVRAVSANDIPVAHTPPGGYRDRFPAAVLATCTEPLVAGAPDLRGLWRTRRAVRAEESSSRLLAVSKFLFWKALGVDRARTAVPAGHPIHAYVERIEQCGNRIVAVGGGTIADARADGTEQSGVHDVSAFDFRTPIQVIATYEQGSFVLRPPLPWIAVTRRLVRAYQGAWLAELAGRPSEPADRHHGGARRREPRAAQPGRDRPIRPRAARPRQYGAADRLSSEQHVPDGLGCGRRRGSTATRSECRRALGGRRVRHARGAPRPSECGGGHDRRARGGLDRADTGPLTRLP